MFAGLPALVGKGAQVVETYAAGPSEREVRFQAQVGEYYSASIDVDTADGDSRPCHTGMQRIG